jgi:hypothetical protein
LFEVWGDVGRFEDPLVRGFGWVVVFKGFRADAFFFQEFGGGAEEVMEESPLPFSSIYIFNP